MNKVILMGRLTRDPDVRYSQGDSPMAIARYTLAVDRRFRRDNDQQTADFISCVAFGRNGEFAEKYLHQGTKIVAEGRIQTGSYTNQNGEKIYTNDCFVESHDFAENKSQSPQTQETDTRPVPPPEPSFMDVPDLGGMEDEFPFSQEMK